MLVHSSRNLSKTILSFGLHDKSFNVECVHTTRKLQIKIEFGPLEKVAKIPFIVSGKKGCSTVEAQP